MFNPCNSKPSLIMKNILIVSNYHTIGLDHDGNVFELIRHNSKHSKCGTWKKITEKDLFFILKGTQEIFEYLIER